MVKYNFEYFFVDRWHLTGPYLTQLRGRAYMKWAEVIVEDLAIHSGHTRDNLYAVMKVIARLPITKYERTLIELTVLNNSLGIVLDTLDKQELEEVLDQLTE